MTIWKQFPFLLGLTIVATGFRTDVAPLLQTTTSASQTPAQDSSRQGHSLQELLPFLEDMLGQIQRSHEIPEQISKGPQTVPPTMEELQRSPPLVTLPAVAPPAAPQPAAPQTTAKTDRLPRPTLRPAPQPAMAPPAAPQPAAPQPAAPQPAAPQPAAPQALSQEEFDARWNRSAPPASPVVVLPLTVPIPTPAPRPLSQEQFDERFGTPSAPITAAAPGAEESLGATVAAFTDSQEPSSEVPAVASAAAEPEIQLPDNPPIPTWAPERPMSEASVPLPNGTSCASCSGTPASNLSFMQCSSRNNYLEDQMKSARESGSLVGDLIRKGPQQDTVIKPQCLRSAMVHKLGENSKLFRHCSNGQASALNNGAVIRPCVSENYYSMISNSFDLVMKCMAPAMGPTPADQKRDIRSLFGMFTVESGMHLNAMSPTGAAGFGQMTQSAIDSVNQLELRHLRKTLSDQGGICHRLSQEALDGNPPMRGSRSKSCDRISIARNNPLTNLLYSVANVLQNKRLLGNDIVEDSRLGDRFDLTAADKRRLQMALSIWAHNTGIGGMKTPLIALLNSKYRNQKVVDVDKFLGQLKQAMLDHPHRANQRSSRKRETSVYYSAIQNQISGVENNAGGGSCVGSTSL